MVDMNPEYLCRTTDNDFQLIDRVEVQVKRNSKSPPERRGYQSGSGGCSYQCELWKIQLYRSCRRTLSQHYINLIVLHCRVKDFFKSGIEPVDLVDKENVPF